MGLTTKCAFLGTMKFQTGNGISDMYMHSNNNSSVPRSFLSKQMGVVSRPFMVFKKVGSTNTVQLMNKTPQIAGEKLVMTSMIQKLAFLCFLLKLAKAKTFQDGDQSIRLYTTISLQLRRFSKIATIVYQKSSHSFQQWVQQEAKQSILQDL